MRVAWAWMSALIGGATLVSGCAPTITHGPRIQPGLQVGGAVTVVALSPDSAGKGGGLLPMSGGAVALGLVSANARRPALLLSAFVPIVFGTGTFDAYLQAPSAWFGSTAVGVGAALVRFGSQGEMVYLELGHQRGEDQSGWYTIQGAGRMLRDDGDSRKRTGLLWLPTVGYDFGVTRRNMRVYIMAIVGSQPATCAFYCDLSVRGLFGASGMIRILGRR